LQRAILQSPKPCLPDLRRPWQMLVTGTYLFDGRGSKSRIR
jgi:hypothetical protein